MLVRGISVSGIAAILRAGWALALLMFAARHLNFAAFSDFSFWLTVSFILALLFDFGQQTGILTKLSRQPRLARGYVKRMLGFKARILLSVLGVSAIAYIFGAFSLPQFQSSVLAIVAAYSGSCCILLSLPFRAKMDFRPDVIAALAEASVVIIGVSIIGASTGVNGSSLLLLFMSARVAGLLSLVMRSPRGNSRMLVSFARPPLAIIRSWTPYFSHLAAGTLIVNIDLLLTYFVLGDREYSLYQAGMRLVQAAGVLFTVINNVFIPSWTFSDLRLGRAVTNRHVVRTCVIAVIFSVFVIIVALQAGVLVSTLFFGESYAELSAVLFLFAVLGAMRLLGALLGALLSARDKQLVRVRASVFGVIALTLLLAPWLHSYGLRYVISVQLTVHLLMMIYLIYGISRAWHDRNH